MWVNDYMFVKMDDFICNIICMQNVEMSVLSWALVTFLGVIYKRFVDVSVDEFVYILKSCKLPFIYFWRICDYNTIL